MPSNRTWRGRKAGHGTLPEAAQRYLRGESGWDGLSFCGVNELCHLSAHGDAPYVLRGDAEHQVSGLSARELVEQYGDRFLAEYIAEHPGRRPAWWWALRELDNGEPLLRQRVGGVGVPWGDHQMSHGRPIVFVTEKNKTWWPGAPGPAIDPANPPLIESQATFLARHDMFVRGEREKLAEDDYSPESIDVGDDD
jgi:hypothetical protein